MNIAILIRHFDSEPIHGPQVQAQGWAELLSQTHRVAVIAGENVSSLPEREEREGYVVLRPPGPARTQGLGAGVPVPSFVRPLVPEPMRQLRAAVGQAEYDRRTTAWITRAITGISPRPDVLVCFNTSNTGVSGVRAGNRLGVPAVVWIRGEVEYRLQELTPWRRRRVSITWSHAAGVVVQSGAAIAEMLAELGRVSPGSVPLVRDRLIAIGNGVTLPELSPLPADGPVLSVGRLVPEKRMDLVIEACAASGRPLIIAGSGPELTALKNQATRLGSDVHFAGFLGRPALGVLYRQASVMVLASQREGLPNVLLEAMSHGLPVISTPSSGIRSLISDGENGLLVPHDDPGALTDALHRLAADPATAARLGKAARRTAEGFEWRRVEPGLTMALERWIG